MEKGIEREKAFWIFIYLCCSLTGILIGYFILDTEFSVKWLGIISIIGILFAEILIFRFSHTIFNFANMFVVFLYLFHLGHVLIRFFLPDYYFARLDLEKNAGHEKFIFGELYSLLFITFCVVGILWNLCRSDIGKIEKAEGEKSYSKRKILFVGGIIIIISFPIHYKISLQQIQLTAIGNYLDSFEVNVSGMQSIISSFLIIGMGMVLLSFSQSKIRLYIAYIVFTLYFAWTMASGGRGPAVISILILTFILLKLVKVSPWKLVIFAVIAYFALQGLTAISTIRNRGEVTFDKVVVAMERVDDPIISALEEFGGTQQTVNLVFDWRENNFYRLGATYVEGLFNIFPNIGGIFTNINQRAIFTLHLRRSYIGGSIVGESYYNFGIFGTVVAVLIGIIVGKMSSKIDRILCEKKYNLFPYYIMPCYTMLWWIRDAFSYVSRATVWAWFLIKVMYFMYDYLVAKGNRKI